VIIILWGHEVIREVRIDIITVQSSSVFAFEVPKHIITIFLEVFHNFRDVHEGFSASNRSPLHNALLSVDFVAITDASHEVWHSSLVSAHAYLPKKYE
jgi:hypothetical protein